jgi:diguanylate cyclase (GGDEF)-like protein
MWGTPSGDASREGVFRAWLDRDPWIVERQYAHLRAHGFVYPLNSLIVAAVFTSIVRADVPARLLGLWFGAVAGLTVVRWALLRWRPTRLEATRGWIRVSLAFAAFSGLLWGSVIWLVPRADLHWQILAASCAALMAMGAVPGLGMVRGAHTVMAFCALLPPIAYFVIGLQPERLLLGVMLAGFLFNIVYAGRLVTDTLLESLRARLTDQQLAHHDPLTGLANRRQFDVAFEQEWRNALRSERPLSLLMMDLDAFKDYNDRYGHLRGDDCLRSVAKILRGAMRRDTDLVARWGGEEFVCLLPATDARGAYRIAETIRKAVHQAGILHAGGPAGGVLSISIGGATILPRPGQTRFMLVEAADQALYEAKRQGRNRVVWVDLTHPHARHLTLVSSEPE